MIIRVNDIVLSLIEKERFRIYLLAFCGLKLDARSARLYTKYFVSWVNQGETNSIGVPQDPLFPCLKESGEGPCNFHYKFLNEHLQLYPLWGYDFVFFIHFLGIEIRTCRVCHLDSDSGLGRVEWRSEVSWSFLPPSPWV